MGKAKGGSKRDRDGGSKQDRDSFKGSPTQKGKGTKLPTGSVLSLTPPLSGSRPVEGHKCRSKRAVQDVQLQLVGLDQRLYLIILAMARGRAATGGS
jgi:hypothetical protein